MTISSSASFPPLSITSRTLLRGTERRTPLWVTTMTLPDSWTYNIIGCSLMELVQRCGIASLSIKRRNINKLLSFIYHFGYTNL